MGSICKCYKNKKTRLANEHHPWNAMASLNEDIIFQEILPSIPAKSLLRFMCISKLWLKTMSNPFFISTHLGRRKSRPPGQIILPYNKDYTFSNQQTGELFDLRLKKILKNNQYLLPLTSCDGLLVIQSVSLSDFHSIPRFYVCNPMTGNFMKLPPSPFLLNPCEMAYDSSIKTYKVMSWSSIKGCAIFTLRDGEMGSWRLVNLPEGSGCIYSRAVLAYGALNWVAESANTKKACILSLNIAEEKIVEIEMPRQEANLYGKPFLIEMKGVLYGVFPCQDLDQMTIWFMKDWEKCQWIKLCKCGSSSCGYSVVKHLFLHGRNRLQNGLQPVREDKPGLAYRIDHVNTLVSWDDSPLGYQNTSKTLLRRTRSFEVIKNLLRRTRSLEVIKKLVDLDG